MSYWKTTRAQLQVKLDEVLRHLRFAHLPEAEGWPTSRGLLDDYVKNLRGDIEQCDEAIAREGAR